MTKRDLDGFYLRVQRNGKWEACCFTDLTEKEQHDWLERLSGAGLQSMVSSFCENIVKMSTEVDLSDDELRVMAHDTAALLRKFGDLYGIVNKKNEVEDE